MSYYNKMFEDIIIINIPLKGDSITPLYSKPQSGFADCYYCNEHMDGDIVRYHDHLNGNFKGYAHNKCNFQVRINFVPLYAYNSTNYDNHLSITKLAKKIRLKVFTKTDENYICIDMGHAKALISLSSSNHLA